MVLPLPLSLIQLCKDIPNILELKQLLMVIFRDPVGINVFSFKWHSSKCSLFPNFEFSNTWNITEMSVSSESFFFSPLINGVY